MRFLIYIFLLTLTSCGPEAIKFQRQYVIENNTVPIELHFYKDGELSRFAITQLMGGEQLEGQVLERSDGPWSELNSEELLDRPSASFESDSVRVIFNDQKVRIYQISFIPLTFTPSEGNLLRDADYSAIGGDKFLFAITESDFENAEDCDGNCD